ncbi:MAG: LysM peptidoglycan-binding domain-containing protein [Armatimonadetes bacterium]|nr:LysM peptidoglycan-binding domain-containing protein [Armatimonadota bacterium]
MTVRQLMHPLIAVPQARKPSALLDSAEIILFTIALGMLMFAAGNWARGSMSERPEPVVTTITVQAGDTLWSIAREYGEPDEYILERVNTLERTNNLDNGRALREGQALVVPVSRSAKMYRGGKICMETTQSEY